MSFSSLSNSSRLTSCVVRRWLTMSARLPSNSRSTRCVDILRVTSSAKMEARGLVKYRVEDRRFLYRAAIKAEEVTRKMSTHLVERLFEGSLADMVSHLLTTHEVSREELDKLEKLIAARKKKL